MISRKLVYYFTPNKTGTNIKTHVLQTPRCGCVVHIGGSRFETDNLFNIL